MVYLFFVILFITICWLGVQVLGGRKSHTSVPIKEAKPKNVHELTYSDLKRGKPFEAETAKVSNKPTIVRGPAYVIDGDSIVIKKTQIRLFGIDAPELNHPYGKKAKWELVKLCKGNEISAEILQTDHFERTVARCSLPDGSDLSAEMVKRGLAIDWPKFSGGVYEHLEIPGVRKKLWLADARQKGRMFVWDRFDERNSKLQEKKGEVEETIDIGKNN